MRLPRTSIRGILVLTIGALTLLIGFLAARNVITNWQRLTQIEALKDASDLSDQIFEAVDLLSVERDVALSMLRSRDPETIANLRPRLEASRKATDQAFAATMKAIEGYSYPGLAELHDGIAARLPKIRAMRPAIDAAVAQPQDRRERSLATEWTAEVTGLTEQTQDLWVGFIKSFTGIDPIATQHLRFKHMLYTIMDYSARERSLIGQLIVENVNPTPDDTARLLRGQGTLELSWQTSRILADQSGLLPAIASFYSDANSHYATMHDMIEGVFYVPDVEHGATYPIGVDFWLELSTEASDSLSALRDAALKATHAYLETLIADTQRNIAGQAAILALALGLCGFSFSIINRRVIRPVNGIVDALLRATRGEDVAFAVPAGRQDEIGKLAQVLYAFQETVTQVRRTAAELDRSQTRLRAVVDYAIDGLITIDSKGIIQSFNRACEQLFGYRAEDVIGKNIKMLMPEPYRSEHDGYLSRYLATGDARIIGTPGREVSAKRRDGSVFPADLSISTFTLPDGKYFSGIVRDISRRKEAEQALMRYNHALERSNKELDDFAYIASHDLKEPLRGIHNHSRFLLEDNADKLDRESVGRLNRLVYLTQRMERLVNDLLYFSRLGRQELAIQPTDLNAVIEDIRVRLEQFLDERKARIVIPSPLPTITCDHPRVAELFHNLITNAGKYNDRPEKTIEIGCLAQHPAPGNAVAHDVFYVKDNGRGIDPEFHDEIFRIFRRLQRDSEVEGGTGVGLTFVKKIVERHGGKIWLDSEPGEGTTFYFTLETVHHDAEHDPKAAA